MTVVAKHQGVMANPTKTLNDKQRGKLIEAIRADPYCALVRAARNAGVIGSKGHIRQLLDTDEQLQDFLYDQRGTVLDEVPSLKVKRLFEKLGDLVENDTSASQYRAITFGLGLRQITVSEKVEHTGADGGAVEVTVQHDHEATRRLLGKLADAGLIQPGPAAAADAAPVPVLPAPSD